MGIYYMRDDVVGGQAKIARQGKTGIGERSAERRYTEKSVWYRVGGK